MRLGVSPYASTLEGAVAVSERAVAGGLDTLWLGDGLLLNPDFPLWSGGVEAMTMLAWLAGRFPGARIGVTAAVLPLRDPIALAREAATLDHVTDGNFVLVVTPGFWARESALGGFEHDARGARFADGIDAVRAVWAGQLHAGPFVTVPSTEFAPRPLTPGGPPLWLAGARATMRRAAALGLPFQVSRVGPEALGETAEAFYDAGGTTLAVRVRMQLHTRAEGVAVPWNAIAGDAEVLAAAVRGFHKLGVTDLSIIPGQDDETSLATVAALADEVVPAVRDIVGSG